MASGRGEARYKLTLDQSGFEKGLKSAEEQFKKFGQTIIQGAGIGAGFEVGEKAAHALVDAIKGLPEAAIEAVQHLEHVAHAIETLHAKTGLGLEGAQELSVGMRIVGGDSEALSGLIGKMQKKLVEGSGAFTGLGLSAKKLKQEDIGKAFTEVAEKIHNITSETERSAARQAIFGKSGNEAAKFIDAGVKQLAEDAHHLGAVLGGETVEAAGKLGQEGRRLDIAWEALHNNFAAAVVEDQNVQAVFHDLAEGVAAAARAARDGKTDFKVIIDELKEIVTQAAAAGKGLGGAFAQSFPLLGAAARALASRRGVGAIVSALPGGASLLGAGDELGTRMAFAREAAKLRHEMGLDQEAPAPKGGGDYDPDKHAAAEKKALAELSAELSAVQAKHGGAYNAMVSQIQAATAKRLAEAAATHKESEALPEIEKGIRAIGAAQLANAKLDFTKSMLGSLRGDDILLLKDLGKAVELAGGTAAMSWPQLQKLADSLTSIGMAGQNSRLGMDAAAEQMARLNAAKDLLMRSGGGTGVTPGMASFIDFSKQSTNSTLGAFGSQAAAGRFEQNAAGMQFWTRYADVAAEIAKENKAIADSDPTEHFKQWTDAIHEAESALHEMATYFGSSWLGTIAGAGAAALAVMDGLRNRIKDMSTAQKVQAGAQAALGALSIYKTAQQDPNAGHRTLGGAESGAAAGAAFGPYGVVIGALAGAAIAFFSGPKWAETATTAGRVLGIKVSNELAKAIHDTKFKYGVSAEQASLLNLDKAMGEGATQGKDAHSFAAPIEALFKMVAAGGPAAKQGIEQIGKAFALVRQEAEAAGKVGDHLMVSMIQQARASNTAIPEIKAAVAQSLDRAVSGVAGMTGQVPQGGGKVRGGIPIATPEDAQAQAQIFSAVFWGKVREDGVVAAAQAMKPAFDALQASLAAGGLDASKVMAPIASIMGLIANEATSGIVTGIQGLQDAFKGLADSGYMTQGAFQGVEQQASSAYQQLIAEGTAPEVALQAIAPLLADLQKGSTEYGIAIDKNTQGLMDQAAAAGIAFPTDPMQQVISLLGQMVTLMGGTLPAAMATMSGAATDSFSAANGAADGAVSGISASIEELQGTTTSSLGEMAGALGASFTDMSGTAAGSLDEMAAAVGTSFTDAVGTAAGALDDIATKVGTLPDGKTININVHTTHTSSGGGGWPGPWNTDGSEDHDDDPDTPFATGGLAPYRPGGLHALIAEQEDEFVIPRSKVQGFARSILSGASGAVQASGPDSGSGGYGGPASITIPVSIGGQQLDEIIMRRVRGGYIRV